GLAGISWPVTLTRAAWARCVAVPPGVACQDEAGRLWDVVRLLRWAIRGSEGSGSEVRFGVPGRNDNREGTPPLLRLQAICGPGVLARLRLCRRRGAAAPARTDEEDVAEIARHLGIDGAALRRVVEEATAG